MSRIAHTTVIDILGDGRVTMEEHQTHPNGRVIIRRLWAPSDDWLQHVMPALSVDDMVESLGLSNLPERILEHLVDRYAHETIPPTEAPPTITTLKQYKQLKQRRVKKQPHASKYRESSCAICLADWKLRELVTTLPCEHEFHHRCVKPWLMKNLNKCPVCRRSVE